jgi:hypothetical protein
MLALLTHVIILLVAGSIAGVRYMPRLDLFKTQYNLNTQQQDLDIKDFK